jgi:hypothetical protein
MLGKMSLPLANLTAQDCSIAVGVRLCDLVGVIEIAGICDSAKSCATVLRYQLASPEPGSIWGKLMLSTKGNEEFDK